MPGFADFVLSFIAQNFWFLYSLFVNFMLMGILVILSMRLGPLMGQILGMGFGRIKRPAGILRFTNAQIATLQIREYSPVIKVDEKEPTSELIHMKRQDAFQMSSKYPEKKPGFFGKILGKKQDSVDRLNEVYTDDFIPIDINKKAISYLWGIPLFLTVEGVNSTINPMMTFTQSEQVRSASIAVEQSLLANKLIAEDKFRKEIATKSDVRNWGLMTLLILGIGLLIIGVIVMGLQSSLDTFIRFINEQWKVIQPAVDNLLKNTPRIIYDSNGGR